MDKASFGSFISIGIAYDPKKTEQRNKDFDPVKVAKRRRVEEYLDELRIEKEHSDIFYE